MTSLPIDQISAQAREIEFGRTMLTILAAIFYALGWIAGRTLTGLWLAIAWSAVAIKVGWKDGTQRGHRRR